MNSFLCSVLVFGGLAMCFGKPNTGDYRGEYTCGYASCNPVKDGMLNVHLVPHTHDDVGWLKTVDQYFAGNKRKINRAGVQYILDSVVPELLVDKTRKFIYVEMAFFKRWWNEQNEDMRTRVDELVNSGQLEFTLGGWSMNDEAATHYNAIIDQHTLGFKFLNDSFGSCGRPRASWQIDPFGHSKEQASLFAQMGFDGLFFARLDYQDKDHRLNTSTMEMVWKGSSNIGERADLFTGVLYQHYGPPPGFCFDISCTDDPIIDDPNLYGYNLEFQIMKFMETARSQAKKYRTSNIMMTMGSDFQYMNAEMWYKNLDKLIKYVNQQQQNGSNINLLYSTPSCYIAQLNKANLTWSEKNDDFFPYASKAHTFWTGYFTSRPALKGYIRRMNNVLQVCKQLGAFAAFGDVTTNGKIQVLREAMGVAQHHDSVTGTEKQVVAYDYAERLATGQASCQEVINQAYDKLLLKQGAEYPRTKFCGLLNISVCDITVTASRTVAITTYNPLPETRQAWIRVPVNHTLFRVSDPHGEDLGYQVNKISQRTKDIPEGKTTATHEVVFEVSLPPLGIATYFMQVASQDESASTWTRLNKQISIEEDTPNIVIKNDYIELTFDESGMLQEFKNLEKDISISLQQELRYYESFAGNNSHPVDQSSGAYIFRPMGETSHPIKPESTRIVKYALRGLVVQEVHQTFSSWATQVTRLYNGARFVEIEWTVGPIPVGDKIGKEIISQYRSSLKNNGYFYTDANGREIQTRRLNYRPSWKLNQTEPIAGNYYPINSRIFIRDDDVQLTVLTDRSEGGASISEGEVEIMLHRRILHDDRFGVGEALNEPGADGRGLIVRGSHYLFVDTVEASPHLHRKLARELFMAPVVSFTSASLSPTDWRVLYQTTYNGLTKALNQTVHILTLEPLTKTTLLLRLENFYEKSEDPTPVTVDLENMFATIIVESAKEMTLGANLPLADLHRFHWNTSTTSESKEFDREPFNAQKGDSMKIQLNPMEIRTFILQVRYR